MKVRIEVGELTLEGLSREEGRLFSRHLEREVARLVESETVGGARSIEHVRVQRARRPATGSEAAADVARVVAKEVRG